MKLKRFSLLMTLILSISLFQVSIGNAKTAELKGEITVWSRNIAAKSLEITAKKFMALNPGVKITVVDIGKKEMYNKMTIGLAAGMGLPDIVQMDEVFLSYISKFPNGFVDLTKKVKKYKKDFDPSKWAGLEYNGKLYGLPWDSGPVAVFYRKDIFEQAGVKAEEIQTWDDYIAAGEKIVKATGGKTKLLPLFYEDAMFRIMLNQLGTFYANKNGEITINDSSAVLALTTIKKVWDKGLGVNANNWDALIAVNKNNLVATFPAAVWFSGTFKDQMPELEGKMAVMPLPAFKKGGNRAANWGGSNLMIPSTCKYPEAAWKYIEFSLASVECQVEILKNYGIFPSYIPAYNDSYFKNSTYYGIKNMWDLFGQVVPKVPVAYYTSDYLEIRKYSADAVSGALISNKDPKKALDEAAQTIANATGRKIAK